MAKTKALSGAAKKSFEKKRARVARAGLKGRGKNSGIRLDPKRRRALAGAGKAGNGGAGAS